jgi:hypothetical protein
MKAHFMILFVSMTLFVFLLIILINIKNEDFFVSNNYNYNDYKINNLTNRQETNKFVVISTTFDDNYTLYIPMIVYAWRRIHIEPILIIIYADDYEYNKTNVSSSSKEIVNFIENKLNVKCLSLKVKKNFSKVISQVIRIFIGHLPNTINDNAFVMTSDSDLAPLNFKYYHVNPIKMNSTITIWNAFCCGNFKHVNEKTYQMFPMGHIGMTKRLWRQVVFSKQFNTSDFKLDGDSVMNMIFQVFGKNFTQDKRKSGVAWYSDQNLISVFIHEYVLAKRNAFSLDLRRYQGSRLDRSLGELKWKNMLENAHTLTDSHLYQEQNEATIRHFEEFLEKFFPHENILTIFYHKLIAKYWRFS